MIFQSYSTSTPPGVDIFPQGSNVGPRPLPQQKHTRETDRQTNTQANTQRTCHSMSKIGLRVFPLIQMHSRHRRESCILEQLFHHASAVFCCLSACLSACLYLWSVLVFLIIISHSLHSLFPPMRLPQNSSHFLFTTWRSINYCYSSGFITRSVSPPPSPSPPSTLSVCLHLLKSRRR